VAGSRAQVAQAEANLANARANYERQQQLFQQKFISQAALDREGNAEGHWAELFARAGWDEFTKARDIFRKYGDWIVFLLRFSPILRTIVSLPAGLAGMKLWRFCLFTALGSGIWNAVLIFGGQTAAPLVERFEKFAGYGVVLFVLAGVAFYIYRVVTWKPVEAHERGE
jgi:membrane protein DedA with SNARE-associated domain